MPDFWSYTMHYTNKNPFKYGKKGKQLQWNICTLDDSVNYNNDYAFCSFDISGGDS